MKLKISIAALILILIMGIMGMTACTTSSITLTDEEQTATDIYSAVKGFAIYLADSGELLLSENEIRTYHSDNSTLELNENGIKKWNSHLTYQNTPELADSLFSREFILKIEGKEICRGQFWSHASSASYSGIVILDSLFKLDSSHNVLSIKSDYPSMSGALDPSISSELNQFFEKHNLLR